MAKKVFAVTNIKGSDVWVDAKAEVNTAQFTREELKALMDSGAIEVREVEDSGPDTSVQVEEPGSGEEQPPAE